MKSDIVVEVVRHREAPVHPRKLIKGGYRRSDPVFTKEEGDFVSGTEELPQMADSGKGPNKAMRARERYLAAKVLARAHMHEYREKIDNGDEAHEIGQRTPPTTETPRTSVMTNDECGRSSCYVEIFEDDDDDDELLDDEIIEENDSLKPLEEPAVEEVYEACIDRTADIPVGGWQSCALDEIDEIYQDCLSRQEEPDTLLNLNNEHRRQRRWSFFDIISPNKQAQMQSDLSILAQKSFGETGSQDEIALSVLSSNDGDEQEAPHLKKNLTLDHNDHDEFPVSSTRKDTVDDDDEEHHIQHRRYSI
mmetsp:Transcript_9130/g.14061  ORF Transcript_9130/g.14061 Transcript_9130/m.14061 type:complete len:306 (-) Transcript_9130:1757-2674(-)